MRYLKYTMILVFISAAGFINSGTAGNISINITDEGTEITGMSGTSNINVNTGCIKGSGTRKAEKRKVPAFSEIDVDGAFDVNVKLQKKQSLEVVSDDNIVPKIITKVKGNTLIITSSEPICAKSGLEVNITAPDVSRVDSDGSNNVYISDMKNKRFRLGLDGAGDVRATGVTGKFIAKLSGSGGVKAGDLHAKEVNVSIDGAGEAVVYASGKLHAEIDGAGEIIYYGNPKEVSRDIDGVGEIEKGD